MLDLGGFRQAIVSAVLGATLLLATGCTSPGPAAGTSTGTSTGTGTGAKVERATLTWSKVTLPAGVDPLTLTESGAQLLVGARAATGHLRPRLLRIASDASSREVRLTAHSGYAFEASWRSVVSDGHRIIGVGGAPGGAHSNTRWTTWAGTNAGVVEVPQSFDTFGGWGAGHVIGPVLTSAGPALAGSWEGAKSGLDAAIWLPVGDRWVRQSSAGSALESTRTLLVGPRSATSTGTGILMPGSAVHLTGGKVSQSAAVWVSKRVNQGWTRVDLPDSGNVGEAVSARCRGKSCVLAGDVDGEVALWRLSPSAVRVRDVPQITVKPSTPIPAPLMADALIVQVVSAGPNVVVLAGHDQHWALFDGPLGQATSSALVDGWVYVIAEQAVGPAVLWRCPVKDLG